MELESSDDESSLGRSPGGELLGRSLDDELLQASEAPFVSSDDEGDDEDSSNATGEASGNDLDPEEAPECLDAMFDNLEERVSDWVKESGRYKTDKEDRIIRRRTLELEAEVHCQSARKKLLTIIRQAESKKKELHDLSVVQTMLFGDTRSVHSICYCREPVGEGEREVPSRMVGRGGNLDWWANVWVSSSQRKRVVLQLDYVQFLLTPHAIREGRYLRNKFSVVSKYHRQQTVDETAFKFIKRISSNRYEMTDVDGCCATVDRSWVSKTPRLRHTALQLKDGQKKDVVGGKGGTSLPLVEYRNEGERCLVRSCASALHYLGHAREAQEFSWVKHSDGHAFGVTRDLVKKLFVNKMGKPVSFRNAHYEPFNSLHRRGNPIVAEIKTVTWQNGKPNRTHIGHVVCFVADYVFDSNQPTALPITAQSLNRICQAVEPGTTFAGIKWSREIVLVGCPLPPRTAINHGGPLSE